jgi:oligopeptide transport system substrate-binding protein
MWRRNLGIDVTLTNQEWKVYLDSQHTQNFHGSSAPAGSPTTSIRTSSSTSGKPAIGNNDTNWGNPEYDRLLRAALAAKTDESALRDSTSRWSHPRR